MGLQILGANYRPGGTDVAVADGGTGASTARAAAAALGVPYVLAQSAVAVPHTGNTSETALATVAVPGGTIGANGRLRVTALFSRNGSGTGNVVNRVKFGGTTFLQITLSTTNLSLRAQPEIANRNAENSQVGSSVAQSSFVVTSGAPVTGTVDTSAAQDVVLSVELANAGDTGTLEYYVVELLQGA